MLITVTSNWFFIQFRDWLQRRYEATVCRTGAFWTACCVWRTDGHLKNERLNVCLSSQFGYLTILVFIQSTWQQFLCNKTDPSDFYERSRYATAFSVDGGYFSSKTLNSANAINNSHVTASHHCHARHIVHLATQPHTGRLALSLTKTSIQ